MRRFVAGNWKMNHGPVEAAHFIEALPPLTDLRCVTVIVFPPAISLPAARAALGSSSSISLGVQGVHGEASGAFTGEIAAGMAAEAGATYALVGHSERRTLFHETDEETGGKVAAAQLAGLTPVLCVGERINERKEGRLEEVIVRQLDAVLGSEVVGDRIRAGVAFLLAYEPVWAIGTGKEATPSDASQAHAILRRRVGHWLGSDRARELPILYGGSVTPANARGLLAAEGVDGVLVGGASLDPGSFARIVELARELC
ncbi:MAG: triose-phosphate isomerase [Gemmatimonadetes bacterium]|nr:triose-phosphate isomerase [Gemmatimonadota bacterium]